MFLKIGLISFGGGYAVIPVIQYEITANGIMTTAEFQEAIALAGLAPGSIATNAATLIGYQAAGVMGAIVSTIGIILPSFVIVVLLSAFFYRLQHNRWVKSSFYGLRPITAGLIVYAALHFGMPASGVQVSWEFWGTLLISGICLFLLFRYKLHPLTVIVAAGVAGIVLF